MLAPANSDPNGQPHVVAANLVSKRTATQALLLAMQLLYVPCSGGGGAGACWCCLLVLALHWVALDSTADMPRDPSPPPSPSLPSRSQVQAPAVLRGP